MTDVDRAVIDVHLDADAWQRARAEEAREGLSAEPPWLSPMWFYDEHGSDLFDQITRLPDYYQTRAERRLLEDHAHDLAALGAEVLVELGSGTSDKTEVLLDAMVKDGSLHTYVPFDVSDATMAQAIARLGGRYPDLAFHGVVGDFNRHLGEIPDDPNRLVAFLGGTIGNLRPEERARFWSDLDAVLDHRDRLLVGIDLVKDPDQIVAAYDDPSGVTAEFNRNALRVLNNDLGADFAVEAFEHVAHWNPEESWIEMRLRATEPQHVTIPALDLTVRLDAGDDILTEVSAKFTPEAFAGELWAGGFVHEHTWTSDGHQFALVLARPCA